MCRRSSFPSAGLNTAPHLFPGDDVNPLCPRVMGVVDPPEDCWKPPRLPAATTSKARKSSSARSIGSSNGRKKVVKKADSVKRLKVGTRSSYDFTDSLNPELHSAHNR